VTNTLAYWILCELQRIRTVVNITRGFARNIRPDWKGFAGDEHASLFWFLVSDSCLFWIVVSDDEKGFKTLKPEACTIKI
jgi:hypothetical protein